MSLLDKVLGNASTVDKEEVKQNLQDILIPDEEIEAAFKVIRDLIVFTDKRMVLADKQGMTGKKTAYHSVMYKSITHFSVETAGTFDADSELKIWIGGTTDPVINKPFKKGDSIFEIQKILSAMVLD